MKLTKFTLLLIILLALFTVWPFFQSGYYYSHDGELHLARIAAYAAALKAGQFPVRWSDTLNFNYGYPIFNFVYPLPYLLSSGLYLIGLPLAGSFNLILALSMILSAIFMYKAIKLWLNDSLSALASAVVYLFAPYRFLDTYVRAALGEAVAFVFPPLLLWSFYLVLGKKSQWGVLMAIFSWTGLILSHNALAIIFSLFLSCFFIIQSKNTKQLKQLAVIGLFALTISAFFWLPALWELKYTLAKYYLSQKDFHDYFTPLAQLAYKSWSFDGKKTPAFIGLVSLLTFVVFNFQLLNKKIDKKIGLFLNLFWLFSIFLTNKYSLVFWEKLPIISFFQTPWRFLSLNVLVSALMAGYLVNSLTYKKLLVLSIILLSLFLSLPRIGLGKKLDNKTSFYLNYPKSTTWHNEASPVWTAGEADSFAPQKVQIIGNGLADKLNIKPTRHLFNIFAQEKIEVIDNTVYFPGWKVYANDQEIPIQFQNPNHRGLITFKLDKGNYNVKVIFKHTKVRLLAEFISFFSLALLLIVVLNFKKLIFLLNKND